MRRMARWLVLLPLVIAIIGMTASALAFRSADPHVALLAADLPAVSRRPVPPGAGAGLPGAFWLVREGDGWRAFADREPGWRRAPLQWDESAQRFTDLAGMGVWDRSGRILGGASPRNLDEFAVSAGPDGYVTVDLSRLQPGAAAPMQVLNSYVEALQLGQPEQALLLIHPSRQTAAARRSFLAAVAPPQRVAGIEGQRRLAAWDDQLRQHGLADGKTWEQVMELKVVWANGERQTIHLVLDGTGAWRLLWSPAFALE